MNNSNISRPGGARITDQEARDDLAGWLFHNLQNQRRAATTHATLTDTNEQLEEDRQPPDTDRHYCAPPPTRYGSAAENTHYQSPPLATTFSCPCRCFVTSSNTNYAAP